MNTEGKHFYGHEDQAEQLVKPSIFARIILKGMRILRMSDPRWENDGPNLDEQMKKLMQSIFGKRSGPRSTGSGMGDFNQVPKKLYLYGLIVVSVLYVLGGFYTVDEKEQAIILRLGNYSSTAEPGLHWRFLVIDKKYQQNVTQQRTFRIERTMLTEDQNIIDVPVSVQYLINDIRAFTFQVENPILSLETATEAALRHVVGTSQMDSVLSIGREEIARRVHERLQHRLKLYKTGLYVTKVNILKGNPPGQVQEAFVDVIKAQEDKERMKNEAEAYANKIIPETRGQVKRLLEEAEAYKQEVIAKSQGDANRFVLLLSEYKSAPFVTRQRLYLETIEALYMNTSKILIDANSSQNILMLPIPGNTASNMGESGGETSSDSEQASRMAQRLVAPIIQELKNNTTNTIRRRSR